MFFGLVSILFAIVLDYGNEYMTKEHKNKFKPQHSQTLHINMMNYCIKKLWTNKS